jgi:hypothetical protein
LNNKVLRPGARVRITQMIDRRGEDWVTEVEGTVRKVEPRRTGSWYAHAKNDKYWLMRVELVKDDGEVSWLTVDQHTQVHEEPGGGSRAGSAEGAA